MSQPTWDSDLVMKTLKSKTGGVRIKQQTINIQPNASDVIQLEMSGKIGKHLVFITGKYSFIHVTRDPFWFSVRVDFWIFKLFLRRWWMFRRCFRCTYTISSILNFLHSTWLGIRRWTLKISNFLLPGPFRLKLSANLSYAVKNCFQGKIWLFSPT